MGAGEQNYKEELSLPEKIPRPLKLKQVEEFHLMCWHTVSQFQSVLTDPHKKMVEISVNVRHTDNSQK